MKKIITIITTSLISLTSFAQNYQWQWAKTGGGTQNVSAEYPTHYFPQAEQILDIKIDQNNNYYFLARATNGNTKIDGNPIPTYNAANRPDIVIFSTTCDGTFRWSQTIGGYGYDSVYNIELDNNGGVLALVRVENNAQVGSTIPLTHFSETNTLPPHPIWDGVGEYLNEASKKGFLLRYSSDSGALVWRKDIQTSNPHGPTSVVLPTQIQIDSNGIVHVIILLQEGTHLDGTVTIPAGQLKYYLAKFNALTGNLAAPAVELPITGFMGEQTSNFRYDQASNTYYITGIRGDFSLGGEFIPFIYNNVPVNGNAYILALNGSTYQEMWRHEGTTNAPNSVQISIDDIQIDNQSNVYISGRYSNHAEYPGVYLGTHQINNNAVLGKSVYVAKLNNQGQFLWSKTPTSTMIPNTTINGASIKGITFNGNQVIIAGAGHVENWGNGFNINMPYGHRVDPYLLFLNKQTGATEGLTHVLGSVTIEHGFTKVATDNDGNYVVGGYTHGGLFLADNDNIPDLYIQSGGYTDFLYAKYAATPCGVANNKAFDKLNLSVYPNPTNDIINIKTDETLQSFQVFNILGQELFNGDFETMNPTISLEKLTQGTYFVKVKTQNNTEGTFKVIKK